MAQCPTFGDAVLGRLKDGWRRPVNKLFVKNNGLAAFLDGSSNAGHGPFFEAFGVKLLGIPGVSGERGWCERARAGDQARHDQGDRTAVTRKKGWGPPGARNEVLKTWQGRLCEWQE